MTAAFMAARIEGTSAMREVPYCPPIGPCPVPSRMSEVSSATLAITVIWIKRKRKAQDMIHGLYVEVAAPNHREVVFLGEIVVPHDHVFSEGSWSNHRHYSE